MRREETVSVCTRRYTNRRSYSFCSHYVVPIFTSCGGFRLHMLAQDLGRARVCP